MNKTKFVIISVLACASAMAQVATQDDLLQVIARRVRHGTAVPGSCGAGQIFIDDDATSGQQFYACSGGSFVLQGDGNGSGAKGLNFVGVFASRPAANSVTDGLSYITDCIDDACSAGGGTIGRLQVDTGTVWVTVSRSLFGLVIGTDVQAFDADLSALAANSTNGIWARTGAGAGSARTLSGTNNEISVNNGDGVSGNPTFSLALTFDISGKTSTKPVKTGTAAPGTCNLGELFYDTDATAGQNLYGCTASNTWTLLGDGTSSGNITTGSGSPSTGAANTFYIDTSASPRRVWIFVDTDTPREIPTGSGSGATNALWTCGTLPSAPSAGTTYFSCNSSDSDRPSFVASTATFKPFTDAEMAAKLATSTQQAGTPSYCAPASASATTYTCALTPTLTAYTAGMNISLKIDISCTGGTATTLNIDVLGPKRIYQSDGSTDPASSDCPANRQLFLRYDGAAFRIIGGGAASAGGGTRVTIKDIGVGFCIASSYQNGSPSMGLTGGWTGSACTASGAANGTLVPYLNSSDNTSALSYQFTFPHSTSDATVNLHGVTGGISAATMTWTATLTCVASGSTALGGTPNTGASASVTSATNQAEIDIVISAIPTTGCTAGEIAYLVLSRSGSFSSAFSILGGDLELTQ